MINIKKLDFSLIFSLPVGWKKNMERENLTSSQQLMSFHSMYFYADYLICIVETIVTYQGTWQIWGFVCFKQ